MSKETEQIRILTEVNKKLLDLFATTVPKNVPVAKPVIQKKTVPKPKPNIK
jgi:hypothetical protein